MNQDQMAGKWKQVKGKLKEQWGKLTDDDLTTVEGNSEQLIGKVQERYGIAREEAERQVREFRNKNRDLEW
ncbi:MAG TPA: CsbD family protein [Methylomirabilota bacterium]|nr:CsbD family protein [Methylomirabilota bacterium]